ncbi:MAG: PAS domain S-box protein [Gemmatimonadetes bacterium]|nr:PAS domain S-box protein [Gemmatimonadota bacterium]MBT5588881.1 PAS domain S-box protein [Gemmatimonadota bacterium]MBT5961417.1 PAS domain S-box protein [Gemmatimonadota bacterium]MBT7453920.1 PAS domain S-box protein [Gemmatimonadota bacterium]
MTNTPSDTPLPGTSLTAGSFGPLPDPQGELGLRGMLLSLEEICRDVVDHVPDIVYRLDGEGNIVYISEAVRKYGYDPIALIGSSIFELVHPQDRDRARFRINERRTGDRSTKSLQLRLVTSDDDAVPFELRDSAAELLVDAQGVYDGDQIRAEAFLYTQGVARDISERFRLEATLAQARARFEERLDAYATQLNQAHQQLQIQAHEREQAVERLERSQQSYHGLVEDLPVGILHSTPAGRLLYANPQVRTMFGYDEDGWRQLQVGDLYENQKDLTDLNTALRRDGVTTFEVSMCRRDGQRIWVRGTTRLVHDPTTSEDEYHGVLEDITERRQMEDERRRLEDQLRQAQRMEAVGQLTAGISHNFNNMLQGISGNLQLALLDAPEPLQGMLRDADRVTHRAAEMVQQMVVFSRHGSRGDFHQQRLQPILISALEICRETFDRKIVLDESISHDLEVVGDATLLQQAMVNLLINARDAVADMQSKAPQIVLQARSHAMMVEPTDAMGRPGVYACIEVRDNGVGMDTNTQRRIFEPFFSTKPVGQGTGLGLATVYGIVSQHGGWIECDSSPGQGTTFRVFVPSEQSPVKQTLVSSPTSTDPGLGTLLIIDDEDLVRDSTARLLERSGYRILTAANGERGLALFEEHGAKIDLVLLDLSMPTMSGHEVLVRLRRMQPSVRVMILTGYAIGDVDFDAAVLRKPFTIAELESMITEVLR